MSDDDEVAGLLIAPTEPPQLKRLGDSSSVPESYGVDVLWGGVDGLCGLQRKEIGDLVASMQDGRLGKEVVQMLDGDLSVKVLLVEGRGKWSEDGAMLKGYGPEVKRGQVRAFLYSIRSKGVWVEVSDDLNDTADVVAGLVRWSRKAEHKALLGRPGPSGDAAWGKVGRREWAVHLLSGFEGIGAGVAESIIDHFGEVPLQWRVTEKELQEVPGIGKVRAKKLVQALERMEEKDVGRGRSSSEGSGTAA